MAKKEKRAPRPKERGKKSLGELARTFDIDKKELFELVKSKLPVEAWHQIKGLNIQITPEGQDILQAAAECPEKVPKYYWAEIDAFAKNPRFVKAYVKEDLNKTVYVQVSSRDLKFMKVRKRIRIEAITDIDGSSYRHAPGRYFN